MEASLKSLKDISRKQPSTDSSAISTTVSQTGVVKTELIDVEKQDDTLKLIFDDSSSPNSFIIISKSILTLNNLENGYLNLNIRTLEKDKPLYFILMWFRLYGNFELYRLHRKISKL